MAEPFDPDAYLAKKSQPAGAFDPDAYLAAKKPRADVSELESVGRGVVQGATFGFGDEAGGLVQGGLARLNKALPAWANEALGFGTQGLEELQPHEVYREGRNADRRANQAAQDANPKSYLGGQIGGGIIGAVALKPLGAIAASPAAQGALYGLGASEADLTTGDPAAFARAGFDTGVGAIAGKAAGVVGQKVVSPVLGAAGGLVSRAVKPLADKVTGALRETAEFSAAKAGNPMLKGFRLHGDEGVRQMGRQLLDDDLVRPLDTAENIAARLGPARDAAGKAVGAAADDLDRAGATVSADDFANYLEAEVLLPLAKFPAQRATAQAVKAEIDAIRGAYGQRVLSFTEAEGIKRSLDQLARNFTQVTPPANIAAMERLRGAAGGYNDLVAGAVAPNEAAAFSAAKQRFGNLAPADDFFQDFALRQMANRNISPSTYLMGAGGLAGGGDAKGVAMALLNHLGLTRGRSTLAVSADALANVIQKDPSLLRALAKVAENAPAMGRFGEMLRAALMDGPVQLQALHAALSADPAYQQAIQ